MSCVVMEVLHFYPIAVVVGIDLPCIEVDGYPFDCSSSSLDETSHDGFKYEMDKIDL